MIRTRRDDLLGIQHPPARMGGVAGSRLAAAVSVAGAHDVLGAAMTSPAIARR